MTMMTPPPLAADADELLFASDDLIVRRVGATSGELCYVTFDSYTDDRRLDRPGFGEAFFRSRGIPAIHVLSRDNHWYQYGELPDALAAVAAATGGYTQVIAYGSSMGGFAALHFGSTCGASLGIAISPQFSLDPAVVPFERRWSADVPHIRFQGHVFAPLPRQYILYDPLEPFDRQHFALFAARSPTIGLALPHGGHPVGGLVSDAGMFEPMFAAILAGTLDPPAFTRAVRARRRTSGQYLFTVAHRVPLHRARQKVALARMAVATQPDNAGYVTHLAVILDQVGDAAGARDMHRRAISLSDGGLQARYSLLRHHLELGELDAARDLAEALIGEHPGVPMLEEAHAYVRQCRRRAHFLGRMARLMRLEKLVDRLSRSLSPMGFRKAAIPR